MKIPIMDYYKSGYTIVKHIDLGNKGEAVLFEKVFDISPSYSGFDCLKSRNDFINNNVIVFFNGKIIQNTTENNILSVRSTADFYNKYYEHIFRAPSFFMLDFLRKKFNIKSVNKIRAFLKKMKVLKEMRGRIKKPTQSLKERMKFIRRQLSQEPLLAKKPHILKKRWDGYVMKEHSDETGDYLCHETTIRRDIKSITKKNNL